MSREFSTLSMPDRSAAIPLPCHPALTSVPFPFFSTTYNSSNLQLFCFDNDATVGGCVGGVSLLCSITANLPVYFSISSRMLLPQPFFLHAFASLLGVADYG